MHNNNTDKLNKLQAGPSYGRKMMTGLLASRGIQAAEVRVGRALKEANPSYHQARQHVSTIKNLRNDYLVRDLMEI